MSELQVLILNGQEQVLGYLDPDVVEINEINSYQGLKQLTLTHPKEEDGGFYDYNTLLVQGNKIWRNETGDGESCLYILNSDRDENTDEFTINAEEVLVELNDAGVVENTSSTPVSVTKAQLTTWFGDFFTIDVFETPLQKDKITWTGTLTRMMLLRQIEEETSNVFITRYEKDPDSNVIHRYLDFKQSMGVEHTIPIEMGENTDKIEINLNEDDTYRSIVPIIKDSASSGATTDTVKTSTIMNDFKALAVNVGASIPMIIEKKEDGSEVVSAYWNAPFKKDAGSYEVYLAEPYPATYNNIYFKEGSATFKRKIGTVETSETNKYVIYNLCALKLMDKKDPVVSIEADVHDLYELPGGNVPYNVGDTVHIRLPNRGLISSMVEKTEKNPRNIGQSKITIGNSVSGGTSSRSDISRPAGLDSYTLSQIYSSIPGIAKDSVIATFGSVTIASVTANTTGTVNVTVPANTPASRMIAWASGGNPAYVQFNGSASGTTAIIVYRYLNSDTNRNIYFVVFK